MPSLATPRPLLRAIKKQVGKVRVSLRSQGEALEELDRTNAEIQQLDQDILDIQEEARRARVPPGWLR